MAIPRGLRWDRTTTKTLETVVFPDGVPVLERFCLAMLSPTAPKACPWVKGGVIVLDCAGTG